MQNKKSNVKLSMFDLILNFRFTIYILDIFIGQLSILSVSLQFHSSSVDFMLVKLCFVVKVITNFVFIFRWNMRNLKNQIFHFMSISLCCVICTLTFFFFINSQDQEKKYNLFHLLSNLSLKIQSDGVESNLMVKWTDFYVRVTSELFRKFEAHFTLKLNFTFSLQWS